MQISNFFFAIFLSVFSTKDVVITNNMSLYCQSPIAPTTADSVLMTTDEIHKTEPMTSEVESLTSSESYTSATSYTIAASNTSSTVGLMAFAPKHFVVSSKG